MRKTIRLILARAFNRITTYLSIFNFCMLCAWLYDSQMGEPLKEYGLRPGDIILIALFVILFISAIEIVALGLGQEES